MSERVNRPLQVQLKYQMRNVHPIINFLFGSYLPELHFVSKTLADFCTVEHS